MMCVFKLLKKEKNVSFSTGSNVTLVVNKKTKP